MGKFSFGKKDKDKDKAPTENPYAQPPSAADPYTRAKVQAGVATPPPGSNFSTPPPQQQQQRGGYGAMGPPPQSRGPPPQSRGPPPPFGNNGPASSYGSSNKAPENKYGGSGGYGDNKYGNAGGYGQNKYGDAGGSKYGAGGYGGLGRTDSGDRGGYGEKTAFGEKAGYGGPPSNNSGPKNGMMGTFEETQAARQSTASSVPPPYQDDRYGGPSSSGYGNSGDNYDGASPGGYGDNYNRGPSDGPGGYQDRQLTAEEEEEEDVQAAKEDIRQMKREDVSSTRNALRLAAQAEETGRNTLARLGAQGERIHNTEKNLDLAANNGILAEQKARELKTLNGSMFAVHVSNPFTGAERRRRRDEEIMTKHREDRDQREASRQAAWNQSKRMEDTFRDMSINGGKDGAAGPRKTNLAERAKYQFEADSEDEDMENEIDNNIELLSGAAGRLNALARATGKEVEEQNKHLDRIAGKSDFVDDQIHMNRAKLDRIH